MPMSEDELKAIEARHKEAFDLGDMRLTHDTDVPELIAEVRRLRGLIKRAEWEGMCCGCNLCPWCGQRKGESPHTERCPAFTENGEVR